MDADAMAPPPVSEPHVPLRPSTMILREFIDEKPLNWKTIPDKLERLCQSMAHWLHQPASEEEQLLWFTDDPIQARKSEIMASIMVNAHPSFYRGFETLFEDVFARSDDEDATRLMKNLEATGWIEGNLIKRQLESAIAKVLHAKAKALIQGNYESADLFDQVRDLHHQFKFPLSFTDWELCAAEVFVRIRMEEIFDIITSFPESEPAVRELKALLGRTTLQAEVAEAIRTALGRRLNHPGADTVQIIDVYISTINTIRILDSRLSVTDAVRAYLGQRRDTVRCILTSLITVYADLLRRPTPLEPEHEPPDMDWQPAPALHQQKVFVSNVSKEDDILAKLVSIYGTKELFVNEYRLMLADKLLANMDYKTDHERHTLELLKLRFGETSMNAAEVMIKDIDDSVRTNKNIRDVLKHSIVDTVVVSHIFWPKLVSSELKHHPRIQAVLDEFGLVYAEQKNPRKLQWMNPLGLVQLELDVIEEGPDGMPQITTKEFSCEPLLVTLISHFEDRPSWTLEELTNETNVPETVIGKKMSFWEGNNVVRSSKDANGDLVYTLASAAGQSATDSNAFWADAGAVSAVSKEALTEEEDSVYESYIVVMLTSMKQASVQKIHEMLKLMVSSGSETKYNKTVPQLKTFLQNLCRRDKLECGPDGLYKLVNSK